MADSTSTPPPRRRRRKKWLMIAGGFALLLIIFIALLPTFVSWGLGQGMIRNGINNQVNGSADFGGLKASWFGDQSIDGFTVTDAAGKKAVDINLRLRAGLYQLLTQQPGPIDVVVSGTIDGEVREDGSISLVDLVRTSSSPKPPRPSGPFELPDLPPLTVQIAGLSANLKDLSTGQVISIADLTGTLVYEEPAQPMTVDLQGKVAANGADGLLKIKGHADQMFTTAGRFSLRGASAALEVALDSPQGVPLPSSLAGLNILPAPAQVQRLNLNFASDDLTARIVGSIDVKAQVQGHAASSFQLQAALGNMLTSSGELSLRAATANLTVQADNVPFKTADMDGAVHKFKLTTVSNDLTQTIVIAIDSNAQIQGHQPSTLAASLSMDELFAPDGVVQFAIEKITGTVQGATLPTAVVQPFLGETPLVLARDVGPVVDVNASFSAGQTRDITIVADAALVRFETQATVDSQTQLIVGKHLLINAPQVHPDLVKAFKTIMVDRPVDVAIRLTSYSAPFATNPQTKTYPMQQFAATGTIAMVSGEPATIVMPREFDGSQTPPPISLAVSNLMLQIDSPALGQHIDVNGSGLVDGASVTFNERLTNLFNEAGQLDTINAQPVGTLALNNLRTATAMKFLPPQPAVIEEALGQSMNAVVTTSLSESNLAATVQAKAAALDATLHVVRGPAALQVNNGHIALTLTPKLIALLQERAAQPIVLTKTAAATINFQPFAMPLKPGGSALHYELPAEPIHASIESPQVLVRDVPSIAEPLSLNDLVAEVSLQRHSDGQLTAIGNGDVRINLDGAAAGPPQRLTDARYKFNITTGGVQPVITAEIGCSQLSVAVLEKTLGRSVNEFSQWTGDVGDLLIHLDGAGETYKAVLHCGLPNLKGDFTANKDAHAITLTGHTNEFRLPRSAVENRLSPPVSEATTKGGPTAPEASTLTRVLEDIPLSLTIKQIRIPLAMMNSEAFDPKAVSIDVGLSGGPVRIATAAPGESSPNRTGAIKTTLSDLQIAINTRNLAEGVSYSIRSGAEVELPELQRASASPPPPGAINSPRTDRTAAGRAAPATSPADRANLPGSIDISGKIVNLMNDQSKLQLDGAAVQMTANVKQMPTAVVDALANMQGLIVAAVGPIMNATFKVDDFSPSTGQAEARIDTEHGWLQTVVLGRQESFRMRNTAPLKAELEITPALRERLLYKINPFLADIRTTEHPLRASATGILPADFDVSKLSADFEIDIGKVQFDSGSTTMTLLRFAGQDQRAATIPGEVEPMVGRIREGILTYKRFAIHVDKWQMIYSGQVDLVKQTMDLRTELPLAALGQTFNELEAYADKIIVPLVYRGKFGEAKLKIDPDFDIGKEALKAGFTGALDQLLKGKGQGGGSVLDDLFKRIGTPK